MTGQRFRFLLLFLVLSFLLFIIGCGNPTGGGGGGGAPAFYSITTSVTSEVPTNEVFGTIECSPTGPAYLSGTTIEITAIVLCGCHMFARWEGDVTGETSPKTISLNGNKLVKAVFKIKPPDHFPLHLSINPLGAGTVSQSGISPYDAGETVILTAEAGMGYIFGNWSGDLTGSINPTSLTMNATKDVTANFKHRYSLTVNATPETYGTVWPVSGVYTEGDVVSLIATPEPGYLFVSWEGDAAGTQNPVSITMNDNKNISARFREVEHFALTVSVSPSATGTVEPWGGSYIKDSFVVLTAEAYPGYVFSNWSGDASGSTNPKSVQMTSAKNITAVFTLIPPPEYALSVTISPDSGAGHVHQYPAGSVYAEGTNVLLTAEANSGHVFDRWEGDLTGSVNPTNITMTGTKDVTAVFKHQYTLTVGITPEGTGTVEPMGGTYVEGTILPMTASREWGYVFSQWQGDLSGTSNPGYLTMNGNKTVTASFDAKAWEVVGSERFAGNGASFTSLFVNSSGVPYVAYSDYFSGQYHATAQKYESASWGNVGGSYFSEEQPALPQESNCVSLYINDSDIPYVATCIATYDASYNEYYALTLYKYESSSWQAVGMKYFIYGTLEASSLSLQMYGSTPYVAFIDPYNGNKVSAMKYTTTWEAVGSRGFTSGSAECVSLFIDQSDGTPYVAFKDYNTTGKPTVMKYSGGSWQIVGSAGCSSSRDDIAYVSLSVDNGTAYIVYGGVVGLYVSKYNGSWSNISGVWGIIDPAGFYIGDRATIFVADGVPYVSAAEEQTQNENLSFKQSVWRYNGARWIRVGPRCFSTTRTAYNSLFVKDGILYLAYCQQPYALKVTVMKFHD